jgi:hypothetical protein
MSQLYEREITLAREYARKRANETGKAYLVTNYGHGLLDVPANRRLVDEIGASTVEILYPEAN